GVAATKYVEGKLQWTTAVGNTYRFPIGNAIYGAQGFDITVSTGSGAVLGYLEANASAPIYNYAYCDLETHPGVGSHPPVGSGTSGYDGILDQITFNLHSPLQWNITNPSGGSVTQYNLSVLATGGQDISPVVTANGLQVRYLMKNGEPGNPNVDTAYTVDFADPGFEMCPNQYSLTGLTGFSLFTLDGANQAGTALPVELIAFD